MYTSYTQYREYTLYTQYREYTLYTQYREYTIYTQYREYTIYTQYREYTIRTHSTENTLHTHSIENTRVHGTMCIQIFTNEIFAVFADWKSCVKTLSLRNLGQVFVQQPKWLSKEQGLPRSTAVPSLSSLMAFINKLMKFISIKG